MPEGLFHLLILLMTYRFFCLLGFLIFTTTSFAQSGQQEVVCYNPNQLKDSSKKSIRSMALGKIGRDSIKISYHSPGARGRILWGGLVPFDEVWVTGAHNATTFEIGKDFNIGDTRIPAGKYALFTIPGKDHWTVIFNTRWEQHLTNEYDEKEDVARITVVPEKSEHLERLQYFIEATGNQQGKIIMRWEKIKIQVPFVIL